MEHIAEHVGNRVPIIGVGSIPTPDQAIEALEKTGTPLIALGRELIMEPQWVEKVEQGKESDIKTTLNTSDQALLTIPAPLWERVNNYFPIHKRATKDEILAAYSFYQVFSAGVATFGYNQRKSSM